MDEAIPEIAAGGRSREVALTLCQLGRMTSSAWMGCAGPVHVLLPTIEVDNPDTDLGKSGNTDSNLIQMYAKERWNHFCKVVFELKLSVLLCDLV